MNMTTSNRKYHRGLGVDLWTNRGAWFWQLAVRCCGAGTIGSALTENEALREAYTAIEEVSARCARRGPPDQISNHYNGQSPPVGFPSAKLTARNEDSNN
jgi:hypothetical protein